MKKFSTPDTNFDSLTALLVNSQDAKENNSRYLVLRKLIAGVQLMKTNLGNAVTKDDKIALDKQVNGILGPNNGGVATGTYEPTVVLGANCGGAGFDFLYFYTTGGLVTVFGRFAVLPLAIGVNTEFTFTLPILSYFTFNYQCAGAVGCPTANQSGAIFADVGFNRAKMQFISAVNVQVDMFFNCSYIILAQ